MDFSKLVTGLPNGFNDPEIIGISGSGLIVEVSSTEVLVDKLPRAEVPLVVDPVLRKLGENHPAIPVGARVVTGFGGFVALWTGTCS